MPINERVLRFAEDYAASLKLILERESEAIFILRPSPNPYPGTPMGSVALSFLDLVRASIEAPIMEQLAFVRLSINRAHSYWKKESQNAA